jgi:hypothetical protein
MLSRLRPRITYANVVSTMCLFILLGGGAYATSKLPKNSVGSKQIKKNAVTSAKVKNGTLKASDAKKGQFAMPGDLSKYLLASGTAANAGALGGVGPGGFVKGAGHLLSGAFTSTALEGTLVKVPGGTIGVLCDASSGYGVGFSRDNCDTHEFDVFETTVDDGATAQKVDYRHDSPGAASLIAFQPVDSQHAFDVSSSLGYAHVDVFGHFNTSSKECLVRARGWSSP